jgi:hypothetical protein
MGKKSDHHTPKIERFGLTERVWELHFEKRKSALRISQILKAEGYDISHQAIKNWLTKQRKDHTDEARDLISDHLNKHLPDDLEALESIEAKSLENASQNIEYISHEISSNEKFIKHFQENWALRLYDSLEDDKKLKRLAKDIIKQCTQWAMEYLNWMKHLRQERKIAIATIDTKLKYSAMLHGPAVGGIHIYPDRPKENAPTDPDSGQPRQEETTFGEEGKPGHLRIIKDSQR